MGVSVNDAIVSGADKASQDIVFKHFNCITLENSMNAALINPQPGVLIMLLQMHLLHLARHIICLSFAILCLA